MTRTGSLAYYIAAIVCGCFFLAASYFAYFLSTDAKIEHPARDFFFVYFVAILIGWIPQTVIALLLRRLAVRWKLAWLWQWILAGCVIAGVVFLLMAAMGNTIDHWKSGPVYLRTALMFIFVGPFFMATQPLWLPFPAAAATSWVLFLVHRAFQPCPEARVESATPVVRGG
jgi:hypothetical protein